MRNNWKWVLGVVAVLVFLFALPFFFRTLFGYGYSGMMGGYRGWGIPMMGGWGLGGLFMGFGMLLVWAVPIGLLFGVIYGAVKLANKPSPAVAAQSCSNCGRAVQTDWNTCPYCGSGL